MKWCQSHCLSLLQTPESSKGHSLKLSIKEARSNSRYYLSTSINWLRELGTGNPLPWKATHDFVCCCNYEAPDEALGTRQIFK